VGEPNQDWHLDNFASRGAGAVGVPETGVDVVTVGTTEDHPVGLQGCV
jgi:hypothetical protein